ncbi:MAG: glycoside hydrolase family 3 C-terminal domain-containing protein [Akkermansiaceae bacterium]
MKHVLLTVSGLFLALSLVAEETPPVYRDVTKPWSERVEDLLGRMTLEEKAMFLDHKGPVIERFSIRSDQWNQCLNGIKWDRPATLFPVCIAMSATWNQDLIHEVATALSDEARGIYNGWKIDPHAAGEHKGLIYRAPVINIGRNPFWGRNHEAWGEDPYLTGRMAVAYVRGLQGNDPRYLKVAATLKHYAVNNVEQGRTALDAKVSERMLREYWLPHFRDAVVEAKAQSLMASYNAINGTPNNVNHWLLTRVLKEEWQHEGFVVSDLGGVKTMVEGHGKGKMDYVDAVARSVMAGCDFSDKEYAKHIPQAVKEGKLSEERLHDAVRRVMMVRFRLGEFDDFSRVPFSKIPPQVVGCEAHRQLSLKTSQQGIVLLENQNHLLPLDPSTIKRVAVLGPLADRVIVNNYNGATGRTVSALQGLKNRLGDGVQVDYVKGCEVIDGADVPVRVDREAGFRGGASIKFLGEKVGDSVSFRIPIEKAGRYALRWHGKHFPSRGRYQCAIHGKPLGEAIDFYRTTETYAPVAEFSDILLEKGELVVTWTLTGKNSASSGMDAHFDCLELRGADEKSFELEAVKYQTYRQEDLFTNAVELAGKADVAIVCIGTSERVEQEGNDRETLGLTGKQEELALRVIAANPRSIIVQMSAGPLTVPRLKEKAPAMLQAWWGGEEYGNAIADVLLGRINPAGRLPHTVYATEQQVPPQDEYDISKGFTYMHLRDKPLYAFGHGLSYTTFEYRDLQVNPATHEVTVEVRNNGKRDGDEVVQMYVKSPASQEVRPAMQLRGFQRVSLKAGESKVVKLVLDRDKLGFWNETQKRFVMDPGDYEIRIGGSSDRIALTKKVRLE